MDVGVTGNCPSCLQNNASRQMTPGLWNITLVAETGTNRGQAAVVRTRPPPIFADLHTFCERRFTVFGRADDHHVRVVSRIIGREARQRPCPSQRERLSPF